MTVWSDSHSRSRSGAAIGRGASAFPCGKPGGKCRMRLQFRAPVNDTRGVTELAFLQRFLGGVLTGLRLVTPDMKNQRSSIGPICQQPVCRQRVPSNPTGISTCSQDVVFLLGSSSSRHILTKLGMSAFTSVRRELFVNRV